MQWRECKRRPPSLWPRHSSPSTAVTPAFSPPFSRFERAQVASSRLRAACGARMAKRLCLDGPDSCRTTCVGGALPSLHFCNIQPRSCASATRFSPRITRCSTPRTLSSSCSRYFPPHTSLLTPHSSHLTPPAQGARVRPVTGGHHSRLQFHVCLAPLPGLLHAIPSQRQPHLLLLASSLLFRSRRRCAAPIHHLFRVFIPSIIVVLSHPVQVSLSVSKFAPLGDSSGTAFAFSSMHCSCCRPS